MEPSRPMVLTHNPREEEAVVVVCGSTVTSSKDTERSLLMAAHLQKILRLIIIMGVAEQADELLCTSRRTTLSRTSGDYIINSLYFVRKCARVFARGHLDLFREANGHILSRDAFRQITREKKYLMGYKVRYYYLLSYLQEPVDG